ncbi:MULTISPECIES: response regulator [Rhodoplanes]|uniref:response regulator n=1 Tax=Rhodoplanes TaxID=29407 RepID=UPI0014767968|nr:response regulator [Rhodoplanes elegans]
MSRSQPDPHPILIVEDDEIMRVSLEDRFRLEGFTVVSAATIDRTRRELELGPKPCLVITDVRLPDGSGAELFDLCRTTLPGVPVVVMTAFGSVADAVRLVKAGALDYLEKPFDLDDLVDLVRVTVRSPEPGDDRSLRSSLEEAERAAIVDALARNDWAVTKTAQGLGISRKSLWEKMRRYRIER